MVKKKVGGADPLKLLNDDELSGECVPGIKGNVCSSDETLQKLKKEFKIAGQGSYDIMSKLKKMFKVLKERDLYDKPEVKKAIGLSAVVEKECRFKDTGPANSNAWLSNFNIEKILKAWKGIYKKKGFFYFDYHPRDFAEQSMPLETTELVDLINMGYVRIGVVLNTDVSSGPGKHWCCIFCDFGTAGTESDPWTLEFFNSSGNPPLEEFHKWLVSRCDHISTETGKVCKVIIVRKKQLQFGDSECGVYSLYYIWSRLEGVNHEKFVDIVIPDDTMMEFRKALFIE